MQFQVPQFIETEDKIIGPLSLRQFMYIAAAAGLSLMLYFTVQTWLWFVLTIFVVGGGVSLAFVKVNGRGLPQIVMSAASFYWKPQIYVWQPERPDLPKNESSLKSSLGQGFSLEKVVSGLALKNTWRYLQTGSAAAEVKPELPQTKPGNERYQIFQKTSGEVRAAKRVDYR